MSFFLMLIFIILLLYVSYFKVVGLLFRGDQYNKFFATFLSTVVPVAGSIPAIIMASKYERQVRGPASRFNEYFLRVCTIAFQLLTVFLMFSPFFKTESIYATGINLIFGLNVADITIFSPMKFLSFLIVLPFASAFISSVYFKNNIHNVLSYIVSLVCALTVFAIAIFADNNAQLSATPVLWLYCILNVLTMLFSIFSIVKVRNQFLFALEQEEAQSLAENSASPVEESAPSIPEGFYKCAKCGKFIPKGTICECRREHMNSLDRLMTEQNGKETADFCVYCKKSLKPGEKCSCIGDGFGITVKPESFNGRKCSFCGETLIGDSVCVCEKIMKNSKPASPSSEGSVPKKYFEKETAAVTSHISDEMADLEKKIEERISMVKGSIHSNDEQ